MVTEAYRRQFLEVLDLIQAASSREGAVPVALLRRAEEIAETGGCSDAVRAELSRLRVVGTPAPRVEVHELCTVTDTGYLPRALAMIESLDARQGDGYRLHVLCLDDPAYQAIEAMHYPQVVPIAIAELEALDAPLRATRTSRTTAEYSWTCKAPLIRYLLDRHPAAAAVTYLDADLYFFGRVDQLSRELEGGSVLVHRHNFTPVHAHQEAVSGTYNAGMVSFRNDDAARDVLRWWRERCLEWCFARNEDGKQGDQTYLQGFAPRFRGVRETARLGIGTAPWNHGHAPVSLGEAGTPVIGDDPIVFYHMHAFAQAAPGVYVPSKDLGYGLNVPMVRYCHLPYARAWDRGDARARQLSRDWEPARPFAGLTRGHALIALRQLRDGIQAAGLRHPVVELDSEWDLHVTPQVAERWA